MTTPPDATLWALIPAYNESRHIGAVIAGVRQYIADIIVVDDGSCDNTAEVAQANGATVLRHPKNRGKGAALRSGFDFIKDKKYDSLLTIDADGQHDPMEIPLFIKALTVSNAGMILGNRMHDPKGMPITRIKGNRKFSRIISNICGQAVPDSLCGYRLIRRPVLEAIHLTKDRFEIDAQILIKTAKAGFKIDSINIRSIYADETSYIRPLIDGFRLVKLIMEERSKP